MHGSHHILTHHLKGHWKAQGSGVGVEGSQNQNLQRPGKYILYEVKLEFLGEGWGGGDTCKSTCLP